MNFAQASLRQPRGMTLLELLVVIAILTMLMGFSAASYRRMSETHKAQGAAANLEVVLRQARNSAISANAPSFVEIDSKNRRFVPWVYQTVGVWHFESADTYGRSTGAHHEATLRSARIHKDGKIGQCVRLDVSGAYVDLGADPDFDCETGGYLEAYICLPSNSQFSLENYVFSKKNAYSLKISGGELIGNVGAKAARSRNYRISAGRWTKVALAWNLESISVLVDDAIVGRDTGPIKTPLTEFPLLIGHETASLPGLVDEARVMAVFAGRALDLLQTYSIRHTATPWSSIHFAADGSLDMHYHAGPLSITLIQGGKERTVTISMLGTTTRKEVEAVPPEDGEGEKGKGKG
ncbi:MAG: prepilin-type N-terminal cleavage/methylation domain-containing protein [Planctomycetota bacterium]